MTHPSPVALAEEPRRHSEKVSQMDLLGVGMRMKR